MRLLPLAALALFAMTTDAPAADKKRPMQIDDLFKFKRVADPQISPDGKHVVYQVTTVDLDGNKSSTALYLAATDGKTSPKQLTNPNGKKTPTHDGARTGRRSCSNPPAVAPHSFTQFSRSPAGKRRRSRTSAPGPAQASGVRMARRSRS